MNHLATVSEIVEALGGNAEAARLFGLGPKAVNHWRASNKLPPHTYIVILQKLAERGLTADIGVWSFTKSRNANHCSTDSRANASRLGG